MGIARAGVCSIEAVWIWVPYFSREEGISVCLVVVPTDLLLLCELNCQILVSSQGLSKMQIPARNKMSPTFVYLLAYFHFFKAEAWQDPGDLTCSVGIVGPSAARGNALVATITWGRVVLGTVAVGGKFRICLGQIWLPKLSFESQDSAGFSS